MLPDHILNVLPITVRERFAANRQEPDLGLGPAPGLTVGRFRPMECLTIDGRLIALGLLLRDRG
jgi:hypothetical protein